ncbi:hypothetical protein [Desulfomonile tiedjei]|uniref:Uncharacterized protein n=1 Tax=Desulfomonile tiedjei (strain ATCC 49306 / DSM 6799 / DCB-1) TaxID=706587 RepID=I4C9S3_DESTA|nr:hypothetical protein [Desulfomonile tiedjei]AFM26314.1 hypothetical protein Desti_3668 [Desulfomonile tiedjei DSM 6799]
MRICIAIIMTLSLAHLVHGRTFEEYVLVNYDPLVSELKHHGFGGPLGKETAEFALIRQLIEDGTNRDHSVSIVGMSVGGVNGEVMSSLGLEMGKQNEKGLLLKRVYSADGNPCYAICGPRANICSAVAIVLLWDKYITQAYCERFNTKEISAWKTSKELSRKIELGTAGHDDIIDYCEFAEPRRRALMRANRMYSSTAAGVIESVVQKLGPLFKLRTF